MTFDAESSDIAPQANMLPLQPRPVSDISHFGNFAVPARRLTPHEQVIYDRMASDWAQLSATAQSTLYAAFLQGKLTQFIRRTFANTLEESFDEEERFSNPRARAMMQRFNQALLQEDEQILLGFKATAARKMDGVLQEPYPDAPAPQRKPNLWQRLLGAEG